MISVGLIKYARLGFFVFGNKKKKSRKGYRVFESNSNFILPM